MQHKSRPGRLLVTRKEHQKIAVEKFSLSVRATTTRRTTRTTSTGSRTWLKCAHVQKCHCFGFGRKQSGEAKAKNFLFPFHTPPRSKEKLGKVGTFSTSPCRSWGRKKKTEGTG
ncbi:GD19188 [Drosophila simulans]|uniref:GD19188 n=1 Tax=Drosophila simulans TaxID=7240 RepID=B4QV33_DROSI|nr:GD19188 [Drosophila simulans]